MLKCMSLRKQVYVITIKKVCDDIKKYIIKSKVRHDLKIWK